MSKSIAQKKSAKKKKGEHSKSRIRVKEYAKSRAPHCAAGQRECGTPSMLVRNHINELLRIEIEDWRRGEGSTEIFKATAIFRDGQQIERTATRHYRSGEREDIFSAEFSTDEREKAQAVKKADAIRKFRWAEKQRIVGELQRQYAKGLP